MTFKSSLFGTDGIRGTVNQFPIDSLSFLKISQSIGLYMKSLYTNRPLKCVIGKDTRESGYMIECALVAGLVSLGIEVYLVGPMPTPAVAFLTRSMRAHMGIMISASHNPFHDNGIKVFDNTGNKLDTQAVQIIESQFYSMPSMNLSHHVGKAKRIDDVVGRYIEYIKSYFPSNFSLEKYRIVLDCANGAAYKIAPIILRELGAEVIIHGNTPDGRNINGDCGSLHPHNLAELVKKHQAHLGIALDGDADRVVLVDEQGQVVSGECLLGFLGTHNSNTTKTVVTTIVANPALELFLQQKDIQTIYTDVGDSQVHKAMAKHQATVGGEPSGHILFGTDICASDGLLTALQCLEVLNRLDKPVSVMTNLFQLMPTLKKDIPVNTDVFKNLDVTDLDIKDKINSRYVVRKSGTESLVRVQLWHVDPQVLENDFNLIYQAFCARIAEF